VSTAYRLKTIDRNNEQAKQEIAAMGNSRFSGLVYRIIASPDRWHHDYIEIMHQALAENDAIDAPENFSELAIGDQILNRIRNTNEALIAFGTLLDKSRFKMIILDDAYRVIYRNQNAAALYTYVQQAPHCNRLKLCVENKVALAAEHNEQLVSQTTHSGLCAVDYLDQNQEQLHLRTIHNHDDINGSLSTYYLLLVVDQQTCGKMLNPELVERYQLTEKEQSVLLELINGHGIRQIASNSFVSENTVKTHLKSLYRKTETKSQAAIVRLVLTDESQILDTYFGTKDGFSSKHSLLYNERPEMSKDKFMLLDNDLKVAYREYGPADGKPIIVCHNSYGCRVTIPHGYEDICRRQNKRIIIPDRPGFGLTPYVQGHPNNWNSMLAEFIEQLGIQSYDLLGMDLGSVIALDFAAQADDRLKRVRLSSPMFVNTKTDTGYLIGIFAPVTKLIQVSKRFALQIYELWLKSVTINLSLHYRSMLEAGLGSAERELFINNNTIDLMIEGFRQASSKGLDGISHEMVHCLSPRNLDLSNITVPVDLWWGTEDSRITLEGVENIASPLANAKVHVREGYSEYIYYALFEDIIS
jgi:pimeloyl-ACP methyl ester carboxylesterase/DNA-binding NarL/FixJ family response regulator